MDHTKASFFVLALMLSLMGAAHGQAVERKQVTLGVGGKTALYYLPLTICGDVPADVEKGGAALLTLSL